MRCVGQLKKHLNSDIETKINQYTKEFSSFYIKEKNLLEQLKQAKDSTDRLKIEKNIRLLRSEPVDRELELIRSLKTLSKDKKEEVQAEISKLSTIRKSNEQKWKSSVNNDINITTSELNNNMLILRRKLYRVSGEAQKYLSIMIEQIANDILELGIDITLRESPDSKAPKVTLSRLRNVAIESIITYPLIAGTTTLKDIQTEVINKDVIEVQDDDDDDEDDHKSDENDGSTSDKEDPIKKPSYRMVMYNIFKRIRREKNLEDKKLCCAVETKEGLSKVIVEFIERLAVLLSILVGKTAKASTINDQHILSAVNILYYLHNNDISNSNYNKFITIVEESKQQKKTLKNKKDKVIEG